MIWCNGNTTKLREHLEALTTTHNNGNICEELG